VQVSWPPRNRSIGSLDVLGGVGIVGLLIARFIPVAKLIPFWGCGFRRMTGFPCPGCGLTRVADHFSHGHLEKALEANPLGTVAAAGFAVLAVWTVLHLAFRVPFPNVELSEREWKVVRYAAIILFVVNYAAVIVLQRFPELVWG
jgi:hypothetical protein